MRGGGPAGPGGVGRTEGRGLAWLAAAAARGQGRPLGGTASGPRPRPRLWHASSLPCPSKQPRHPSPLPPNTHTHTHTLFVPEVGRCGTPCSCTATTSRCWRCCTRRSPLGRATCASRCSCCYCGHCCHCWSCPTAARGGAHLGGQPAHQGALAAIVVIVAIFLFLSLPCSLLFRCSCFYPCRLFACHHVGPFPWQHPASRARACAVCAAFVHAASHWWGIRRPWDPLCLGEGAHLVVPGALGGTRHAPHALSASQLCLTTPRRSPLPPCRHPCRRTRAC